MEVLLGYLHHDGTVGHLPPCKPSSKPSFRNKKNKPCKLSNQNGRPQSSPETSSSSSSSLSIEPENASLPLGKRNESVLLPSLATPNHVVHLEETSRQLIFGTTKKGLDFSITEEQITSVNVQGNVKNGFRGITISVTNDEKNTSGNLFLILSELSGISRRLGNPCLR